MPREDATPVLQSSSEVLSPFRNLVPGRFFAVCSVVSVPRFYECLAIFLWSALLLMPGPIQSQDLGTSLITTEEFDRRLYETRRKLRETLDENLEVLETSRVQSGSRPLAESKTFATETGIQAVEPEAGPSQDSVNSVRSGSEQNSGVLPMSPADIPKVALIMGVGDYSGSLYQDKPLVSLPGVVEVDLALMQEKLTELGFEVDVVANPTFGQAGEALKGFRSKLEQRPGVALFYFSGHGVEYDNANFLIPKGAKVESAQDIFDVALNAQLVLNAMTENAKVSLMFLDCCRDTLKKSVDSGGSIARMRGKGSFIGYAARSGTSALGDRDGNGSPYTRALVKHLATPGVSIPDMHGLVVEEARMLAAQIANGEPVPDPGAYTELSGQPFHLVPASVALTSRTPVMAGFPSGTSVPKYSNADRVKRATKTKPYENNLGMRFVKIPGTEILCSIWETRVSDFDAFATSGAYPDSFFVAPQHVAYDPSDSQGTISTSRDKSYPWRDPGFTRPQDGDHPVVCVTPRMARAFCDWLSELEGLRYRLPTDAEWSLLAGLTESQYSDSTPISLGSIEDNIIRGYQAFISNPGNIGGAEIAGHFKELGSTVVPFEGHRDNYIFTAPVGSSSSNELGLCDLVGNVWELTSSSLERGSPEQSARGSSFLSQEKEKLSVAARFQLREDLAIFTVGFRVIIDNPQ